MTEQTYTLDHIRKAANQRAYHARQRAERERRGNPDPKDAA